MSKGDRADSLEVKTFKDEDAESLIRKFSRKVRNSGMMQELLDRRFYEKPSQKRRKKRVRDEDFSNK